MTKHLSHQPERCLQCLHIKTPEQLTHGRCGACRAKTSAAIWNEFAQVRADAFSGEVSKDAPILKTTLDFAALVKWTASAEYNCRILGNGRIMELFSDDTGKAYMRYWLPITAQNNPFQGTAEELVRSELFNKA